MEYFFDEIKKNTSSNSSRELINRELTEIDTN